MPAVKFTERPLSAHRKHRVWRCESLAGHYLGDVNAHVFFPGARAITLSELLEITKFMVKSQRN